jgi:hypothetical protein
MREKDGEIKESTRKEDFKASASTTLYSYFHKGLEYAKVKVMLVIMTHHW